ncbi:MAG: hypothetical protein JWO11_1726 [Nocardioides sp.]|nr:hypothetical protein [Nocardioides sp.]
MAYDWKTELPGVVSVHSDECPVRDGRECLCGPLGFRASIRDGETTLRTVSSSFDTPQEALTWQRERSRSQEGSHAAARGTEVGALIVDFLQAAEDGLAQDSRGLLYTPDRLHALRGGLSYVDSELGRMAVDEVRRRHVQGLIAQLRGAGVDETRVVAVAEGLHELYSYAVRHDVVGFSPVVELDLSGPGAVPPHVNGYGPSATSGGAAWTSQSFPAPLPPQAPPRHAAPSRDEGPPFTDPGYPTGGFPMFPQGPPAPVNHNGSGPFNAPYGAPGTPNGTGPFNAPYGAPGTPNGTGPFNAPYGAPGTPNGTGPFSSTFGTPGTMPDANYDATMQERWLWWTVRIIVIVFVLIALVLVAESV